MSNNLISDLSGAKSLSRIFAFLLCLLAFQTALIAQEQPPEIPAHLGDNPVALREYFQKQQLLQTAEKAFPSAKNGESRTLAVGGVDPTFTGGVTEGRATVNSTAIQPDGKILIGGFFTSVNGTVQRRSLERLNADGTRDTTFNPNGAGANGTVYVIILLADGKILISGFFTTYNDIVRGRIARLNADGTLARLLIFRSARTIRFTILSFSRTERF